MGVKTAEPVTTNYCDETFFLTKYQYKRNGAPGVVTRQIGAAQREAVLLLQTGTTATPDLCSDHLANRFTKLPVFNS